MPITTATRKGISAVVAESETQRIVLTNHGRPVAIVDSAERMDDLERSIREASLAVLESAAELVHQRSQKFSLDEICSKLGLDAAAIRKRSAEAHRIR